MGHNPPNFPSWIDIQLLDSHWQATFRYSPRSDQPITDARSDNA